MGTHIGNDMTDEKVRCDYQPLNRLKRKMFLQQGTRRSTSLQMHSEVALWDWVTGT